MNVKPQVPLLMFLTLTGAALLCAACSLEGDIFSTSNSGAGNSSRPGGQVDTAWYGNGSAAYFSISTAQELAGLAELTNMDVDFSGKTITQTANIDLSVYGNWLPIGYYYNVEYGKPFTGVFDGGGFAISKLTINSPNECKGLFSCIGSGGMVKNVKLTNVNITAYGSIGGVTGYISGGTVENCSVEGNITGDDTVGGIVGEMDSGTVKNCYVTANVTGSYEVGGIVGRMDGGTVQNCVALNEKLTNTNSSSSDIGRIAGSGYGGSLTNNYAKSDMAVFYNYNGSTGTPYIPADTTNANNNADGKDVASGTGTGQYNNQGWWSGTVYFDFSTGGPWKWDFTANLPVLK